MRIAPLYDEGDDDEGVEHGVPGHLVFHFSSGGQFRVDGDLSMSLLDEGETIGGRFLDPRREPGEPVDFESRLYTTIVINPDYIEFLEVVPVRPFPRA